MEVPLVFTFNSLEACKGKKATLGWLPKKKETIYYSVRLLAPVTGIKILTKDSCINL